MPRGDNQRLLYDIGVLQRCINRMYATNDGQELMEMYVSATSRLLSLYLERERGINGAGKKVG